MVDRSLHHIHYPIDKEDAIQHEIFCQRDIVGFEGKQIISDTGFLLRSTSGEIPGCSKHCLRCLYWSLDLLPVLEPSDSVS